MAFKFDFGDGSAPSAGAAGEDAPAGVMDNFAESLASALKQDQAAGAADEDAEEAPLAPEIKRRVDALLKLHESFVDIELEFNSEYEQLLKKYEKLYAPVFSKRADIISGAHEPTDDELPAPQVSEIEEVDGEDEKKENGDEDDEDTGPVVGIPAFWLHILNHYHPFSAMIDEEGDEYDCLSHLIDIRAETLDVNRSFALHFHFQENPYFSNTVISKKFFMKDDPDDEDEYHHGSTDKIEWYEGKNFTKQMVTSKKFEGEREVDVDCFFTTLFTDMPMLGPEETNDEHEENRELELRCGLCIRDSIVPRAIRIFTGELVSEADDQQDMAGMMSQLLGGMGGMGGLSGLVGGDDDEDYEEGDSDDDDEAGAGGAGPECKTQ